MLHNFLGKCHLWEPWDFWELVQIQESLRRFSDQHHPLNQVSLCPPVSCRALTQVRSWCKSMGLFLWLFQSVKWINPQAFWEGTTAEMEKWSLKSERKTKSREVWAAGALGSGAPCPSEEKEGTCWRAGLGWSHRATEVSLNTCIPLRGTMPVELTTECITLVKEKGLLRFNFHLLGPSPEGILASSRWAFS